MSEPDEGDRVGGSARKASSAVYERFLDVLMTGFAIIVPVIITLYLVRMALDFVSNALTPFVALLEYLGLIGRFERVEVIALLQDLNVYAYVVDFFSELVALTVFLGIVLVVGSIGHNRYGEQIIEYVDLTIASIPGIGTVYKSFRRMGDVMLDSEAENFQDVKLVRCLDEEMYLLGFETSVAPTTIEDSTGHDDMITMFIPMAPNPVTGGFLTYVPRENVYEIDMTIEDGVKSILTSGVATGKGAADASTLSLDDVQDIARFDQLQDALSIEREDDSE